ncbi:unnamed protein product [Oppiella nova]|uniref:exodeoxyribonuclease III n=1 Tax=Oppiella nova TaxID=334625 RepID=A0A7R9QM42_9ACAR|nr:unnamed protein product [Oppiella nova]CAG2167751.1 unnamed protein product [Oppiella nova]
MNTTVSVYALNAGQHLEKLDERHQWNRHFRKYVHLLDGQKAVIICGDFNVAHKDLDCSQWLNKPTTPGCSPRERHDFTRLLSAGFVDTYRHLYPDESDCYTTCSYGNWHNGWRFDYFLVSEQLMDNVRDSLIMQQMDRDHNPITLRVTG